MALTTDIIKDFEINLESRTCSRPWPYSQSMLMWVSRTFALNIQVLPRTLHRSVLLAYLFCRMADTVEDDEKLDANSKEELLKRFRKIFHDPDQWRLANEEFVQSLPKDWENSNKKDIWLTQFPEWPLELFFDQSDRTVDVTSKWVDEMCKGMTEYTLKRETKNGRLQVETVAELDDYCYYVAGTVGYMLTDLFAQYSSLIGAERYQELKALSNSFGLALQITNIIKDIHEDYHRDTCYVPAELMREQGLEPDNFLDPANKAQAKKVVQKLVLKALDHLDDALDYSLKLPRLEPRLRLFCLWPLFMASRTLAKVLNDGDVLGDVKVKITRPEVKSIIRATTFRCISNSQLRKLFEDDRKIILQYGEMK